jgi:hypothetical protein
MKKIKLNSSLLQFKKETIAKLTNQQMEVIFGGATQTTAIVCTNSGAPVCNTGTAITAESCAQGGCTVTIYTLAITCG